MNNVAERKRDFEAGAPFHEHRIDSLEHAVIVTEAADKDLEDKEAEAKKVRWNIHAAGGG